MVTVHASRAPLPATERRRVADGVAPACRPRRLLEPGDSDHAGAPRGVDGSPVVAEVLRRADGRARDPGRRLRPPGRHRRRPGSRSGPALDARKKNEASCCGGGVQAGCWNSD